MPTRPDFATMARAWLVRARGHASPSNEESLAAELERAWELGIANAIEAVDAHPDDPIMTGVQDRIRELTDKPTDPRGN